MNYVDSEYIINIRRKLHRHPEIGYDLPMTQKTVAEELEKIGLEYTDKYAPCSLVSVINPHIEGFTIALRADMDALPIEEETGLPFSSENKGAMHACGHDAHTACLLGAAKYLFENRDKVKCRVKLIFQPNEEGADSAADLMAKNGVLNDVDVILAMHVENPLDSGQIGWCKGLYMASCRNFTIEFFGKTAHASLYKTGVDALFSASSAYMQIRELAASLSENCLCYVGALCSGNAHNVVPDYARILGTLRSYDLKEEAETYENIKKIAENAAKESGCTFKVSASALLPNVYNNPSLTELFVKSAKTAVGEKNVIEVQPKMSSEDFADFSALKPAVFFRMGTGGCGTGKRTAAHESTFVIDESALHCGADALVQFVLDNGI